MSEGARIDVVYTWVDDSFPGYGEEMARHAGTVHDRNPNRTRDNLELLKYSLRGLARRVPWAGRVHLLTCRPQLPDWLDCEAPGLRIHHHDEIMDPAILPTYNSFAILSHLHLIPGLSERFLYVEDDMLFDAEVARTHFLAPDGRIVVRRRLGRTAHPSRRDDETTSPWNASLARANHLLDTAFGAAPRHVVNHVPLLIDKAIWTEMLARWPDEVRLTRESRFRRAGNIAPEHLYPHYLLAIGAGIAAPFAETYRRSLYFGLGNSLAMAHLAMALIRLMAPRTLALNDNFDDSPNPRVVAAVRAFLQRRYPTPSPFEKAGRGN